MAFIFHAIILFACYFIVKLYLVLFQFHFIFYINSQSYDLNLNLYTQSSKNIKFSLFFINMLTSNKIMIFFCQPQIFCDFIQCVCIHEFFPIVTVTIVVLFQSSCIVLIFFAVSFSSSCRKPFILFMAVNDNTSPFPGLITLKVAGDVTHLSRDVICKVPYFNTLINKHSKFSLSEPFFSSTANVLIFF